jgi:hypothetical protein
MKINCVPDLQMQNFKRLKNVQSLFLEFAHQSPQSPQPPIAHAHTPNPFLFPLTQRSAPPTQPPLTLPDGTFTAPWHLSILRVRWIQLVHSAPSLPQRSDLLLAVVELVDEDGGVGAERALV